MAHKKSFAEITKSINEMLRELCKNSISIDLSFPCSFVFIMKDGELLYGEQPDGECFSFSDSAIGGSGTEINKILTALERAEMILLARKSGAEAGAAHYISDREICGIFKAAFTEQRFFYRPLNLRESSKRRS